MTFLTGLALGSFLAASTADAVTTHQARARGAVEGNPLVQSEAVMVGTKVAGGVAMTVFAQQFEKQHPKLTRLMLIAGTGASLTLAQHNRQRGRR